MDIALAHLQPLNHLKCELKFFILKIILSQLMDIALPHIQPQNHLKCELKFLILKIILSQLMDIAHFLINSNSELFFCVK